MVYLILFSILVAPVAVCDLSQLVASGGSASLQSTGFSCCRAQALGTQASVVAARGLCSSSEARGIFPDQGSNLCPQHWQADS